MDEEKTNVYGDDIHLETIDASTIYKTIIKRLEGNVGEPLYPGDERRIFGEALVAVLVSVYNTVDDTARQTMLRYARGEVLDALGERVGVKRLEGSPSHTVLRFSVDMPVSKNIVIPKWTKVQAENSAYFATDVTATLQAGAYSVDVPASSIGSGAEYNGYAEGTITGLVDLLPYISKVANITPTTGGDDGEPYTQTGDDRLRERIRLAQGKYSTAGSELAYIYWAMTADASIIDVKAISESETIKRTLEVIARRVFIGGSRLHPSTLRVYAKDSAQAAIEGTDYTSIYNDDLLTITLSGALSDAEEVSVSIDRSLEGVVKIVPLLANGRSPDDEMLQKIIDTCNASSVRPLTDKVIAAPPDAVSYDVEIVYYTTPEAEAQVVENIENSSGGAVARYNEWQQSALGRDINPDQLRRLILAPDWAENLEGALRVEVISPQYTELKDTEVARFSGTFTAKHYTAGSGA